MRYHSYWYGDEADREHRVEWDSVGFTYLPNEADEHYAPQILTLDETGSERLEQLMAQPLDALMMSGWLYLLLGHVLPSMKVARYDAAEHMLARARAYMVQHLDCTVAELSAALGMSQSSLYSLFRKHSGVSIREMRNQLRIERAVELLTLTDLSVEEIARRLEFSSAAYFRVVFREVTGKTPRDVRREERGRRIL
jgi:AraC-like DNA-binding protein